MFYCCSLASFPENLPSPLSTSVTEALSEKKKNSEKVETPVLLSLGSKVIPTGQHQAPSSCSVVWSSI